MTERIQTVSHRLRSARSEVLLDARMSAKTQGHRSMPTLWRPVRTEPIYRAGAAANTRLESDMVEPMIEQAVWWPPTNHQPSVSIAGSSSSSLLQQPVADQLARPSSSPHLGTARQVAHRLRPSSSQAPVQPPAMTVQPAMVDATQPAQLWSHGHNSSSSYWTRFSGLSCVPSPMQESEAREFAQRMGQRAVMREQLRTKRDAARQRAVLRHEPFQVARQRAEQKAALVQLLCTEAFAGGRTGITFLPRLPEAAELARLSWARDPTHETAGDAAEAKRLVSSLSDDSALVCSALVRS